MAKITISKPLRMSQSSTFETFGDVLSIKRVTEVSVATLVSSMNNPAGTILSAASLDELQSAAEYSDIQIGSTIYKRVRITGHDFPSGNLNKNAVVTLKFKLEYKDQVFLEALSGVYADLGAGFTDTSAFLDSINESVSLSCGENSAQYSKEISLRFNDSVKMTGGTSDAVITATRAFVTKIFDFDASNGYIDTVPDITMDDGDTRLRDILDQRFKKLRSETLNLITKECSFKETLDATNILGDYSHVATQSYALNEGGIVTVTENGSIAGLVAPLITSARIGYSAEVGNARDRLKALYDALNLCAADLTDDHFTSFSKTEDEFSGKIEYTVTGSNDPKLDNVALGIQLEQEVTLSIKEGYSSITGNGTVKGIKASKYDGSQTGFNRYPAYKKARDWFNSNVATLKTSIKTLLAGSCPNPTERNESHSPFQGQISYSISYSTDPRFALNDQVKQYEISSNESQFQPKSNQFVIINDKIVVQKTAGHYEGSLGLACNLVGYRVSPSIAAAKEAKGTFLGFCKARLGDLADGDFLKSASFDYSYPNNVTFALNCEFYKLG